MIIEVSEKAQKIVGQNKEFKTAVPKYCDDFVGLVVQDKDLRDLRSKDIQVIKRYIHDAFVSGALKIKDLEKRNAPDVLFEQRPDF